MIQTRYSIGACAVSLILAGCGSGSGGSYQPKQAKKIEPAKVVAGQEAAIFPWKVGNQWTYSIEGVRQSGNQQAVDPVIEATYRVTDVKQVDGGEVATMEIKQGEKVVDRQVWRRDAKGLFQVSVGLTSTAFDPPQPAILFPIEPDRSFKWAGTGVVPGGTSGSSKSESKIVGPQEVDTDMDRVSGIAVETQTQWTSGNLKGVTSSVAWWTPGTGIVRFKQTIVAGNNAMTQLMKLKSATLK